MRRLSRAAQEQLLKDLRELAAAYGRLYAQTGHASWIRKLREVEEHIAKLSQKLGGKREPPPVD